MKKKQLTVQEMEVVYMPNQSLVSTPKICSSEDAYNLLFKSYNTKTIACQEEFIVLYVNRANVPLGIYRAAKGGMCSTTADVRLVMSVALKALASGIIISHNHPSGALKPSIADDALTHKMRDAGRLLEIPVLDHIIVTPNSGYYSYADEGMI